MVVLVALNINHDLVRGFAKGNNFERMNNRFVSNNHRNMLQSTLKKVFSKSNQ